MDKFKVGDVIFNEEVGSWKVALIIKSGLVFDCKVLVEGTRYKKGSVFSFMYNSYTYDEAIILSSKTAELFSLLYI